MFYFKLLSNNRILARETETRRKKSIPVPLLFSTKIAFRSMEVVNEP